MDDKLFEDELIQQFDLYLHNVIRQSVEGKLLRMIEYHMGWGEPGLGHKGKRSRPMVCILLFLMFGDRYQKVLPVAAAVELIHSFSLIYDDIQDKDKERRGKPAIWSLWGEDEAINAGSHLHTLVFKVISEAGQEVDPNVTMKMVRYLSQIMLRMVEGQQRDIQMTKQNRFMDEHEYLLMISGKTAALFEASAYLGALTAGSEESNLKLCRKFGLTLGMAFQIFDDIMGIWGGEVRGPDKPSSDLEHRKKSYPLILTYKACSNDQDKEILTRYASNHPMSDCEYKIVLKILDKFKAKEKTLALGFQYLIQSIQALRRMKGRNRNIKSRIENWMLYVINKQLHTIGPNECLSLLKVFKQKLPLKKLEIF